MPYGTGNQSGRSATLQDSEALESVVDDDGLTGCDGWFAPVEDKMRGSTLSMFDHGSDKRPGVAGTYLIMSWTGCMSRNPVCIAKVQFPHPQQGAFPVRCHINDAEPPALSDRV